MVLVILIAIVLLGGAVALVSHAARVPQLQHEQRLIAIAAYGFPRSADEAAARRGGLRALARRIGTKVDERVERVDLVETRHLLVGAGRYTAEPEAFIGYQVMASVGLSLMILVLTHASIQGFLFAILFAVGGWVLPQTLLRRTAEKRRDEIDYELPELVDLLVVTVEAGLGLGAALQTASNRIDGPLADELRLTLQEQRMGLPITEALSHMLARVDTASMRSFVRSLVQGEGLGVSIGTILRNLAHEMRTRRRASAQERAHKAPVKMLFPLVFLMFPSLFIVLLAPAAMNAMHTLSGGV